MPITRTYECPDCEQQFSFLHLTRDEPPPAYCVRCGADMGAEPIVALPKITVGGGAIARSVDTTINDYMEATQRHARENGIPGGGITDMKDSLREGEIAVKTPDNIVSRTQNAVHEAGGGGPWQANVQEYVAGAKTGQVRDTGASALEHAIQPRHLRGRI